MLKSIKFVSNLICAPAGLQIFCLIRHLLGLKVRGAMQESESLHSPEERSNWAEPGEGTLNSRS